VAVLVGTALVTLAVMINNMWLVMIGALLLLVGLMMHVLHWLDHTRGTGGGRGGWHHKR